MGSGIILGVAGPSAAATDAPTPTTTTLHIDAPSQVGVHTTVRFRATITPSEASGRVVFTFVYQGPDPIPVVDIGDVVDGEVSFTSVYHDLGTQLVTAQFVPAVGTEFDTSTSATLPLVVTTTPAMTLARQPGGNVPNGSRVYGGGKIQVLLSGYIPGTYASLHLNSTRLPGLVPIDGYGDGVYPLVVPRTVPSGTYYVTASSGSLVTSAAIAIVAAPAVVSPIPTPDNAPTPVYTIQPVTVTVPGPAGMPSTGSAGSLAHTGADPIPSVSLSLVLVAMGALLIRLGATGVSTSYRRSPRLDQPTNSGRHKPPAHRR